MSNAPPVREKNQKRDDEQGGNRQSEEPMQQNPDQTDGLSSLDFNFLSHIENGTDMLERTTEPAEEKTSTLESPSAFMKMNQIFWRAALRAILKMPRTFFYWNLRGEEEQKALPEYLSWKRCPKKSAKFSTETMRIGRDVIWTELPSWNRSRR